MRFSYHTEQSLPYPVERVFAFFADPNNLPLLMPEWQKARIENASVQPPPNLSTPRDARVSAAGVGSHLTLSFRPFPCSPVRVQWEAEIDEFAWNKHFCDRQVRGPFAYWRHCHYVRPVDLQGIEATVIADDLEYELPLGPIGHLAHSLFVRRQIERTFAYRQRQLSKMMLEGFGASICASIAGVDFNSSARFSTARITRSRLPP